MQGPPPSNKQFFKSYSLVIVEFFLLYIFPFLHMSDGNGLWPVFFNYRQQFKQKAGL